MTSEWPRSSIRASKAIAMYYRWQRALAMALFAAATFGFIAAPAQALVNGNLNCGTKTIPRYTFEAGQQVEINISGSCTVTRRFPYGAALNQLITLTSGSRQPRFSIINNYTATTLPEVPLGSNTGVCLGAGSVCKEAKVGTVLPYNLTLKGTAPAAGNYNFHFQFGVTSINWMDYAEWIFELPIIYTVTAPACSLSSVNSATLNFGSLSSADYASAKQTANISVTCLSAKTADLVLTSSQTVYSAAAGLSYTSLTGLFLQAQWADTASAVTLNATRTMQLAKGSNTVAISFVPYVLTQAFPTGTFQNQYTLTINYR
ncbi:fimbrial protein [Pseudomonas sp. ANT_H14]|uniref:fimbrial protein n=1 Tax=unclassified Pseudomonas TaxID=196821 RepID=UPI0011EF150C|nr:MULTISPECIES: fimbrial protein [unclassified Pseudomonas]KAA0945709.1 fimbrial protein [Pseudomonas sp. ANT_H4]KAA0951558.1 fimbrial protein [Pseudomonas sp. ANT_H14]